MYAREQEDLCEHLAIASRHLDLACQAAPATERSDAIQEIRIRKRNFDALTAAFVRRRKPNSGFGNHNSESVRTCRIICSLPGETSRWLVRRSSSMVMKPRFAVLKVRSGI